jgi:hypothetical protein
MKFAGRLFVAYVWWLWIILLFLAVGVVVTTIVKLASLAT